MNKSVNQWLKDGGFFPHKSYKIFYNQFGFGDDLIIIHGYPYSSYEWKEVIPFLSQNFKVTVFDLLGMGFSDKPIDYKYSFEDYRDIVNKLTLHLKIEQAHILAHDLGVSIAQELINNEKEYNLNFSIKSICFTNGNLFPDVYRPRMIQRFFFRTPSFIGRFLSQNISKKTIHNTILSLYGKFSKPTNEYLEELWEILNYNNGRNISYLLGRLIFEKKLHQQRWTTAMKETNIPLSYICCSADPNSGLEMGITFHKRIPNRKLIWMDDSIGHWPMQECPNAFVEAYLEWLTQLNLTEKTYKKTS